MDFIERVAVTDVFTPEGAATVAANLAREDFKKNCGGVVPETDKEKLVAVVTVSVSYEVQPKEVAE